MIKEFRHNGILLGALISKEDADSDAIKFYTDKSSDLQTGYAIHPKNSYTDAHIHKIIPQNINSLQEVLIVTKGKIRVDFYSEDKQYVESAIVPAGMAIMLISGGHGIKQLEDSEYWEVKQGPFIGDENKIRFAHIPDDEVVFND